MERLFELRNDYRLYTLPGALYRRWDRVAKIDIPPIFTDSNGLRVSYIREPKYGLRFLSITYKKPAGVEIAASIPIKQEQLKELAENILGFLVAEAMELHETE